MRRRQKLKRWQMTMQQIKGWLKKASNARKQKKHPNQTWKKKTNCKCLA